MKPLPFVALNAGDALRDQIAIPRTDLMDTEFRQAAIEPAQTCIDTAPPMTEVIPDLRQGWSSASPDLLRGPLDDDRDRGVHVGRLVSAGASITAPDRDPQPMGGTVGPRAQHKLHPAATDPRGTVELTSGSGELTVFGRWSRQGQLDAAERLEQGVVAFHYIAVVDQLDRHHGPVARVTGSHDPVGSLERACGGEHLALVRPMSRVVGSRTFLRGGRRCRQHQTE